MLFTKLDHGFTSSSVWELPDFCLRVWLTILTKRDDDGLVEATSESLARIAIVEHEQCLKALEQFMAPDKRSRNQDHEGRRLLPRPGGWYVVSHTKYLDKGSALDIKRRAADRQRKRRSRLKAAEKPKNPADVTLRPEIVTPLELELESDQELEIPQTPADPIELEGKAAGWLEALERGTRGPWELEHGGDPTGWKEVRAVAEAFELIWQKTGKLRHGTDPRCRAIVDRFSEGFTVADLIAALNGAKLDRFYAEKREVQQIQTLLRDAAQVDKFKSLLGPIAPDSVATRDKPPAAPGGGRWSGQEFEDGVWKLWDAAGAKYTAKPGEAARPAKGRGSNPKAVSKSNGQA